MWALFGLLAGAALCFSFTPQPVWHLICAVAGLMLGGLPALAVLAGKGPLAVRSFHWAADGTWQLVRANGRPETGHLTGATVTLGPWILLAWHAEKGRLRRRYALIGVGQVGPHAFRTLKGRLCLPGSHHCGPVAP